MGNKKLCDGAWAIPPSPLMIQHGNTYHSCSVCGEPCDKPEEVKKQYTGHKNRKMPDGKTIIEWLKPTIREEIKFYGGIEMPTDEQIAVVVRSMRMHHLMEHAAGYDQSELHSPDQITKYWPIESSIGRFLRDAPLETLDKINIGERGRES